MLPKDEVTTDALLCTTTDKVYLINMKDGRLNTKCLIQTDQPIFDCEICDLDGNGDIEILLLTGSATLENHGVSFLGDIKLQSLPTYKLIGFDSDEQEKLPAHELEPKGKLYYISNPLGREPKCTVFNSQYPLLHIAVGRLLKPNQQVVCLSSHTGKITEKGLFRWTAPQHLHILYLTDHEGQKILCHLSSPRIEDDFEAIFTAMTTSPQGATQRDSLLVATHNMRSKLTVWDLSDGEVRQLWSSAPPFSRIVDFITSDFNRDGLWDIVALQNTVSESYLGLPLLQGADLYIASRGKFLKASSWSKCYSFITTGIATDLNKDGWQDLIIADASGRVHALLNEGGQVPRFIRAWQWALGAPAIRQYRSRNSITSISVWNTKNGPHQLCVSTLGGNFVSIAMPPTTVSPQPVWLVLVITSLTFLLICLRKRNLGAQDIYLSWSSSLRSMTCAILVPTMVGHSMLGLTLITMGSFDGAWDVWRKSLGAFFICCPFVGFVAPFFSLLLTRCRLRPDGLSNTAQAKLLVEECARSLHIEPPVVFDTRSPIPFVTGLHSKKAVIAVNYPYLKAASVSAKSGSHLIKYWIYEELGHIKNGDVGFANWLRGFVPLLLVTYSVLAIWLTRTNAYKFLPFQTIDLGIATMIWCALLVLLSRSYLSEREAETARLAGDMTCLKADEQLDPVTGLQMAMLSIGRERGVQPMRCLDKSQGRLTVTVRLQRRILGSLRSFWNSIVVDWSYLFGRTDWRALPRVVPTFLGLLAGHLIDATISVRHLSKEKIQHRRWSLWQLLLRVFITGIVAGITSAYSIFVVSSLHIIHDSVLGFWPFGVAHDQGAVFWYRLCAAFIFVFVFSVFLRSVHCVVLVSRRQRVMRLTTLAFVAMAALSHALVNVFCARLGSTLIIDFPSMWPFYVVASLWLLIAPFSKL